MYFQGIVPRGGGSHVNRVFWGGGGHKFFSVSPILMGYSTYLINIVGTNMLPFQHDSFYIPKYIVFFLI